MNTSLRAILKSGLLLGLIALLGTLLLATVNKLTHDRIIEQEERRVLRQLNEIVVASAYNNDLHKDVLEINDAAFSRQPVTVYRARMDGHDVALIMRVIAADGYNGNIHLLVGIDTDGTLLGVRVTSHRETPGLGDPIELRKSDWVLDFTGKRLDRPGTDGWAVKKNGGDFDQFTGATISPRAVVKAVHQTLQYFESHQQTLFAEATDRALEND